MEKIDRRAGELMQEFKEVVFPGDYDPDGKPAAKRKVQFGITQTFHSQTHDTQILLALSRTLSLFSIDLCHSTAALLKFDQTHE